MDKYLLLGLLIIVALALTGHVFIGIFIAGLVVGYFKTKSGNYKGYGDAAVGAAGLGAIGGFIGVILAVLLIGVVGGLVAVILSLFGGPAAIIGGIALIIGIALAIGSAIIGAIVGAIGGAIGHLIARV